MEYRPTEERRLPELGAPTLATGMQSETRIDWEYFELTRALPAESGGALAGELVALFVGDAPEAARGIRVALGSLRARDLAHEAHRLKGMALALGAISVAERASEIEQLGRTGALDMVLERLVVLDRQIAESIRLYEGAVQSSPDHRVHTPSAAVAREPRRRRRGEHHGLTVLLADDNAINRLVAREMLVAAGAEVGEAIDGVQAVQRLQEAHFDVVLMDLQMPTLDGIGAVQQIRALANERCRDVPVIALTASAHVEDGELLRQLGFQAFLRKPLTPDSLLDAIDAVLA